jgi:hypothetical protein
MRERQPESGGITWFPVIATPLLRQIARALAAASIKQEEGKQH